MNTCGASTFDQDHNVSVTCLLKGKHQFHQGRTGLKWMVIPGDRPVRRERAPKPPSADEREGGKR